MRYPNKTYEIPDGRKLTVTLLADPMTSGQVFHMELNGSVMINFGFTGLVMEDIGQKPLNDDEFLLDIIHYPWAPEWFEENELAEPTGEKRTWLKDSKDSFDTGNINKWELSANPNAGIPRFDYPVYRINLPKIREGAVN